MNIANNHNLNTDQIKREKNKITILIPNGTGPTNVGDQAILTFLVKSLTKSFPNYDLILHSSENTKYNNFPVKSIKPNLYSWSVLDNRNPLRRIYRLNILLLNLLFLQLNLTPIGPEELQDLIEDYKKADLIVFVGGGYLRSQKGLTQSLNLLMLLLIFQFSKYSKAKKIIAPMSFGPFAYKWQEKISAQTIMPFEVIFARENYSFNRMKKLNLKPLAGTDLALLLSNRTHRKHSKFVLGFTVRNWLQYDKQRDFERNVADSIIHFHEYGDFLIQPIIQVDAPKYGDLDTEVTNRIIDLLNKKGIKTLKPKKVLSLESGLKIYSQIDMLLGMRMHSNIMAALVGVPFVAISYEYKTEGIAQKLGIKDYVIKCEDVVDGRLYKLLVKAYKNREQLSKTVTNKIKKMKKREGDYWMSTFSRRLI